MVFEIYSSGTWHPASKLSSRHRVHLPRPLAGPLARAKPTERYRLLVSGGVRRDAGDDPLAGFGLHRASASDTARA